jgi:hypothetical protein
MFRLIQNYFIQVYNPFKTIVLKGLSTKYYFTL